LTALGLSLLEPLLALCEWVDDHWVAAHRNVPEELTAAIRAAGVHSWTIWRSGLDLFHVVECDDYRAMLARLEQLPVNVVWQARMAELLDVVHDYSGEADAELPVAWRL
jgi:L-rhamnose mutarotase